MKKFGLLALAAVLMAAAPCFADPIMKYNYFDLGYRHMFFDEKSADDGNGLEAKVSFSPVEHFFLEGGYQYMDTGIHEVDIDANTWTYGVGGYLDLCEETHLIARAGGIHEEIETDVGDADEDGYYAGLKVRYDYDHQVELDASATYSNVDSDGAWTYDASVLVPVADSVAVQFNAEIDDETNVGLLGGLRFTM